MKLYVWRNVLNVVGDGIIAVMATSEGEAREIIKRTVEAQSEGDNYRYGAWWLEEEIEGVAPSEVYETPVAVWCVGSE